MEEWKDDLKSSMRVYSVSQDDAIDLLESDIVGYAGDIVAGETLTRGTRDPNLIKPLPGRHLRAAVVKALPMAVAVGIDEIPSMNGRAFQAFRIACLVVENLPVPGASLGPTVHVRLGDGREHKAWSNEDLDRLQSEMGRNFMYEVGAFIYERSLQGKARSDVPRYTPQQYLARALEKTVLLHAERNRKRAGIDSSESPAASSTSEPSATSGAAGAAPVESSPTSPAG